MRTGYSAIADEWVPIKPGTDGGAMLLAILTRSSSGAVRPRLLVDYTNSAEPRWTRTRHPTTTYSSAPTSRWKRLFDAQNKLWWDRKTNGPVDVRCEGCDPYLLGSYEIDGRPVKTAFQMLKERVAEYTPEVGSRYHRYRSETIKRLHEMASPRVIKDRTADPVDRCLGARHDSVVSNPVAFHSMRPVAHSNNFQTIRALGS